MDFGLLASDLLLCGSCFDSGGFAWLVTLQLKVQVVGRILLGFFIWSLMFGLRFGLWICAVVCACWLLLLGLVYCWFVCLVLVL